ncbi:MAG: 50S ribosome-binding GTPase [Pirellulaceae bacterium]|nr:50S ribosome-binding GTPase [Pirellulaceae bacterium]
MATLSIAGPGARRLLGDLLVPRSKVAWERIPPGQIHLARSLGSRRPGSHEAALDQGEEVVVAWRDADCVEIHCHGGIAASERLLGELQRLGCELVGSAQWLRQPGCLAGLPAWDEAAGPLSAAAALALTQATTRRTAAILLDQFRGALRDALAELAARLRSPAGDAADNSSNDSAGGALASLLARAPLGCHLARPWTVVLAGRPNVGKSSLINAAVGYERAIVYDQPGTTRDLLTAATAIDGWPVELTDTAGLRPGADPVEEAGVERAMDRVRESDLTVLVFDASQPWSDQDERLCRQYPQALVVHNKSDLCPRPADGRPPGLLLSAKTRHGLAPWFQAVSRQLVPDPPAPGEPVPFAISQWHVLLAARQAFETGDRLAAATHIERLLRPEAGGQPADCGD